MSACTTGKWKTIGDRYIQMYKKSGSGADGVIEDPAWMVCRYSRFRSPSIKPKRSSGNFSEYMALKNRTQPSASLIDKRDGQPNTIQDQTEDDIRESSPSFEPTISTDETRSHSSSMSLNFTETPVVLGKRKCLQETVMEKIADALRVPIAIPPQLLTQTEDPYSLIFRGFYGLFTDAKPTYNKDAYCCEMFARHSRGVGK